MININGEEYYSYAEAILALQKLVADLEAEVEKLNPDNLVTKADLTTTLTDYAKTSDLTNYVKSTDTGYTKLLSDNDVHNTNWTNIIADLKTLEEN